MTPELNEQLLDNVAAHQDALDDKSWLAVTESFHAMVCGMSGNPLLNLLAAALKDIYTARVSSYVFPEENRDHVRETHGAIAEAIINRDAATAERLMLDHMAKLADFFEARYPGLMDEPVNWQLSAGRRRRLALGRPGDLGLHSSGERPQEPKPGLRAPGEGWWALTSSLRRASRDSL